MSTRIILHGGNTNRQTENNRRFYQEIISSIAANPVSVLCIYFARPESRWEDSYADDRAAFMAASVEAGRSVVTKLATYDLNKLVQDMAEADVIFINGGYQGHLKDTLLAIGIDKFRQLIEGKTLVGSSAGANMLAKFYYSYARDNIREGIGLLEIKVLTHFADVKTKELQLLQNFGEELPIIKVAEEEYVVLDAMLSA